MPHLRRNLPLHQIIAIAITATPILINPKVLSLKSPHTDIVTAIAMMAMTTAMSASDLNRVRC